MAAVAVDVAVIGSLNQDVVVRTPTLPHAGETTLAHGHRVGLGGKGGNQAVAAARLGARVAMVACVGDDGAGRDYGALLAAERIDRRHVRIDSSCDTGRAFVLVDDAGENCILVSGGSNAALAPADVNAAAPEITNARVTLVQLEVPLEATEAALRIARGIRVLNAAPAAPVPASLLELVDVLIVNETELAALADVPTPDSPLAAAEAAANIRSAAQADPPAIVIVTLGRQGSVVRSADGSWWHEPACDVTAVDTTAAGDAFCGALAAALAAGVDIRTAVRRATLVSGVVVTRAGAIDSLPTLTDIDKHDEGRNQ